MKGIILTFIFLSFALGHFDIFASRSCPTGQIFNSELNRCVYTEGSIKNRDEHTQCESIENPTEKKTCIKNAADQRQQKTINDFNSENRVTGSDAESTGKGNFLTGFSEAYGITSGVTALFMGPLGFGEEAAQSSSDQANSTTSSEASNTCKSCMLLGGVSLYSFYQTKVNKDDVKDKTDKLKEEYEEISNDSNTMKSAQLAAYDMLEKEQQYVADVSKKQASQYKTLALGYTAASALALYEVWSDFGTSCAKNGSSWDFSDFKSGFKSLTNNPCAVLFSGIITVPAALKVSAQAKRNKEDAQENVNQVKELKKKYVKSIASFCPDGREDISNPACYCYTAEGNKSPYRQKSKTCQNFWNKYSGEFVIASDASRAGKISNPQGCIYKDGKFDRECNCRKLKNNKGENACQKVTVSPGTLSNALGGLDVTEGINAANAATQGNGATYKASTSDANAAMAAKAMETIKKKIENPFKKASGISLNKVTDKIAKDLARRGDNNVAIFNGAGASEQFARFRPTTPSFQNAISEVKSKSPVKRSLIVRKKARKRAANKDNANKWRFDEGSSNQVLSYGSGASDGASKKRYDYGDNDIIKDKSVSIFKVISHRYVQSGLKKLFEE